MTSALFPYQQTGAEWLAERSHALLADEMGLGKTVQAIRGADLIGARKILVICPAIAKINWQREFERWQQLPRSVRIINSRTAPADADVTIVNYELLHRPARTYFENTDFDLLICDEAHALKTGQAVRTRAVYGAFCDGRRGLIERCARVWLLTGTPVPNNVSELWPHLRALWGDRIANRSFDSFVSRFCQTVPTDWGYRVVGVRNAGELRDILSPVMLRRRKADVLTDLPPIRWTTVPIDPGVAAAELWEFEQHPEFRKLLAVLQQAWATTHPDAVARDDQAVSAAMRAIEQTDLSRLRRLTATAKAEAAASLIDAALTEGGLEKVVVFAWHRDAVARIHARLKRHGAVMVDGSTPAGWRQKAIDDFQRKPKTRVFVGQIDACGTAITLTAASTAVFVELSWSPAANAQAANRVHRIGQADPVLIQTFTLAGSIDEAVTSALARKTRMISDVLEDNRCSVSA